MSLRPYLLLMLLLCARVGLFGQTQTFNPGLLWRTGHAPAPSLPLQSGNRAWYIDAAAPDGGDGSQARPYNTFEAVIGGPVGGNYVQGPLRGGDHVYLTGEFLGGTEARKRIEIARATQGGTASNPTLITAWPGRTRPVLNGQGTGELGIILRNCSGLRIESLEIKQFSRSGLRAFDTPSNAFLEIVNCEVHHNCADVRNDGSGIAAGIGFHASSNCAWTVRNNVVYANQPFPAAGIMVLTEGSMSGGLVDIHSNIVFDSNQAIAHKHSGGVPISSHHNMIHGSQQGFYLRAFRDNQIHHNLVLNCELAVVGSRENMQESQHSTLHHNTFVHSGAALTLHEPYSSYPAGRPYVDHYAYVDNIHVDSRSSVVLGLGHNSNEAFSLANWSSGRNIFQHASGANFLINQGRAYAFAAAMAALGDQGSITADPRFLNAAQNDFRLADDSPARGFGAGGTDIGALPHGSSYILDLNRYTIMPTGSLTLTSPNGGESWRRNEARAITWTAAGVTENLVIELMQGPTLLGVIATGIAPASGSYTWTVGRLADGTFRSGTNLKIRIRTAPGQVLAMAELGASPSSGSKRAS